MAPLWAATQAAASSIAAGAAGATTGAGNRQAAADQLVLKWLQARGLVPSYAAAEGRARAAFERYALGWLPVESIAPAYRVPMAAVLLVVRLLVLLDLCVAAVRSLLPFAGRSSAVPASRRGCAAASGAGDFLAPREGAELVHIHGRVWDALRSVRRRHRRS
eukprot:TRINITY_DN12404_c0_g1_i2.p1 TRINITY_DN12404_c0_g1~~TRINITY_DN12404_c0_g1_i2.p1  ORF type:complete len:162 (+),score=21.16 TRINITY_DN12404_c0_g1_i2:90-575(+)